MPTAVAADAIDISATPIRDFAIGVQSTRFGALEFVGGLELRSTDADFGGISGLRLLPGRQRFVAVSDTGHWFAGKIARNDTGVPTAIDGVVSGPLAAAGKNGNISKRDGDCEGLAIAGNDAFLSFERNHRIERVALKSGVPAGRPVAFIANLKRLSLSANKGIEALAVVPPVDAIAPGALLAIAEDATDANGNLRGFILRGKRIEEFSILRRDGFAITDADFLPGGDLLILERDFSFSRGPRMRIRRISGQGLRPGALVDGPVLIDADASDQIDNMEALAVSTDETGTTYVTLASDDNFSALQRTVLLEFRLVE